MYRKITAILFISFLYQYTQCQPVDDAATLFNRTAEFKLTDAGLNKSIHLNSTGKLYSLFIFLSPECPLCQNYTKVVNELQEKFGSKVNVYGIIPGNAYTVQEVVDFEKKYKAQFNLLIDKEQQLTNYLKATVTPQGILLDSTGKLLYTGAIDDWVQALGKNKIRATKNYVQDAIEQSLQFGLIKIKMTKAFGCKINNY